MKTILQALGAALTETVLFGALLFVPAGTFDYWQAWVFIAVFAVAAIVPTIYLGLTNPAVLRRRMHAGPTAETRSAQKIASSGLFVAITAAMAFSALDHRFGWSPVPAAISLAGDALVAIGLAVGLLVIIQNSYAAANITVEAGQKVISTGLYGFVRHPMYVASLIVMVGLPLALDSYWGLAFLLPLLGMLAVRIVDEEEALTRQLDGYLEYTQKVHYRLLPYVW